MTVEAGPADRRIGGRFASWGDEVRRFVGVIVPSDEEVFDPPLRRLRIGGSGNIAMVLDGDDPEESAAIDVRACTAGEELTGYAIRQIRLTSTTATAIKGYR